MARLRGVSLKDLAYSVYARRVTALLKGKPRPRHVGVMCDGNRRWAKEMGYVDPNDGHRVGARRVLDLLRWCDEAGGIEIVTLYLLATDNLRRPAAELDPLLDIIENLVTELAEDGNPWRLRIVGALDLLPSSTAAAACRSTRRFATAAGRRSPTRSGRCCRSMPGPAGRWRSWPRSSTWSTSPSTSTPRASPTPTWLSGPAASSGCPVSCSGSRPTRSSTSAT